MAFNNMLNNKKYICIALYITYSTCFVALHVTMYRLTNYCHTYKYPSKTPNIKTKHFLAQNRTKYGNCKMISTF